MANASLKSIKTVCQDGLLIVWSPAVLAFPPRIRSISVTAQLSLVSTMAFYQFMMLRHLSNLPVQPRVFTFPCAKFDTCWSFRVFVCCDAMLDLLLGFKSHPAPRSCEETCGISEFIGVRPDCLLFFQLINDIQFEKAQPNWNNMVNW